jgi:biopolymer transport protein ExbB
MGDIVYVLLGLTSVVGLTFIVERALALRWNKVVPPDITAALTACRTRDDIKVLCHVCRRKPSPLGRLLLLAADHLDWPKADNVDALQTAARHEIIRLERGLVVLEIIVGIAPLLGLVGTIAGMMTLFGDIGVAGLNDAARLAKGIALILNATLMGLLIAIPSLIFWSYFSKKVEVFAVEMEALCDDFIRRQYSEAATGAPPPEAGGLVSETQFVANAKSRKPEVKSQVPEPG